MGNKESRPTDPRQSVRRALLCAGELRQGYWMDARVVPVKGPPYDCMLLSGQPAVSLS